MPIDEKAEYTHLRSLGIDEVHAHKMVEQMTFSCLNSTRACGAIMSFAIWDETEEGVDFWINIHDTY